MDYIVVSTAVTDDLYLSDGTHMGEFLGGAGTYTLCGCSLWSDSVLLVTGVGADFEARHGGWFRAGSRSTGGLLVKDAHTAVSTVRYRPDGERTETPRYGPAHYTRLEATPEDLAPFWPGAKGVYIFKDLRPGYWEPILAAKTRHGFSLLWEINADAAVPDRLAEVRARAEACGLFSLNSTEAARLLGTDQVEEITAALLTWETDLIYLRMGGAGAVVLAGGKATAIPCAPCGPVLDPTGAGNSSTGGVLCGWCQGYSPTACGVMGAISAACCIEQYGPPVLTPALQARAARHRRDMRSVLEEQFL